MLYITGLNRIEVLINILLDEVLVDIKLLC